MRLIEKKCPNCGASLEFNENDKSCKCSYCKRAFEIERDDFQKDLANQFNLKPVEVGLTFSIFTFLPIFIFVLLFIVFVSYQIFSNFRSDKYSNFEKNQTEYDVDVSNELVTDISELSSVDLGHITSSSKLLISSRGEGANDSHHSYLKNGQDILEKQYVAYKSDSNYVISIFRTTFHDFFNQENSFVIYVPVVFENVKKNVVFSLGNGKVSAPEYYFNAERTSYTYGYASFDEAYNGVVKVLENDYKITEK